MLTDGCRADSVPNLEIETGEIAGAGHASTTGRFDDEQLFYLRSRGITEAEARRLVVHGFFADIIRRVGVPEIEERLLAAVEAELAVTVGRRPAGRPDPRQLRTGSHASASCSVDDVKPESAHRRRGRRRSRSPSCTATARSTPSPTSARHAAIPLSEGDVGDGEIECYLHGSRFDLRTGEPLGLPATEPVAVYPARFPATTYWSTSPPLSTINT